MTFTRIPHFDESRNERLFIYCDKCGEGHTYLTQAHGDTQADAWTERHECLPRYVITDGKSERMVFPTLLAMASAFVDGAIDLTSVDVNGLHGLAVGSKMQLESGLMVERNW